MEDNIELVIKMPEKLYRHVMEMQFCVGGLRHGKSVLEGILLAIRTGTPLPKGHGDLIDKSVYRKEFLNSKDFEPMKILDLQEIIIEADKENVIEDDS